MKPITQIEERALKDVSVVAADIDGTITHDGQITEQTIQALRRLSDAGLTTVLITGRSAGCGLSLTTYLPGVTSLIAENGGAVIDGQQVTWARRRSERLQLGFASIRESFPQLDEGNDNFMRLSDYTIDMRSMRDGDLAKIQECVRKKKLKSTYSTVHFHIYDADDSKGSALKRWLQKRALSTLGVLTVGDSVNDESILDKSDFPHSFWVGALKPPEAQPAYHTNQAEGAGFGEIVSLLLSARRASPGL